MSCVPAFVLLLLSSASLAANAQPVVAATVNGRPITVAQLERELAIVVKDRKLAAAERTALQKQVLQHAIERHLVLSFLERNQQAASTQDVDLVIARLLKKLEAEGLKPAEFWKQQGMTEADFRAQQHWELSWQRYLDRYLTEANLQKFFAQNRRDFDGTELRVAHILFAAPKDARPADWDRLDVAAKDVREEILGAKVTFADAAKQHSASPTAAKGGDIGWIKRREPMPEGFSAAAFKLQVGEVSPPVESAFGVHLITCLEIKPGKRTWADAADELRPAVIHYLFRWLADSERPNAKIETTSHWPH